MRGGGHLRRRLQPLTPALSPHPMKGEEETGRIRSLNHALRDINNGLRRQFLSWLRVKWRLSGSGMPVSWPGKGFWTVGIALDGSRSPKWSHEMARKTQRCGAEGAGAGRLQGAAGARGHGRVAQGGAPGLELRRGQIDVVRAGARPRQRFALRRCVFASPRLRVPLQLPELGSHFWLRVASKCALIFTFQLA